MTKSDGADVRAEARSASPGQEFDRKKVGKKLEAAFKAQGFCEPECALIVQIACDTLCEIAALASKDANGFRGPTPSPTERDTAKPSGTRTSPPQPVEPASRSGT